MRSSLPKVFGPSGALCRPLRCKGRCQDPAPTEAVGPLHRTAYMPSCSSGLPLRTGPMAVTPSVVALLAPATRCGRRPADILAGARRALLARARPSARRSLRHAPCIPRAAARLPPRSLPPLSIGQHSPTRASRGCPRTEPPRPRHALIPRTGKARAVAPRSKPRGAGQRPAGSLKGPAAAAVSRALARLWSYLPLPVLAVPRRAGAEIRPRTSPLEEAHAPSTRSRPVECTGRPTQPNNTRPNAPPVVVPHGS